MSFNTYLLDRASAYRRDTQEQQRQQILAKVINWLETVGHQQGIERAYIFGSLTRPGDFTEASDVDIAISGKLPAEFCTLMSLLSTTLGREVDLIHLEKCHFSDRIREKGILWKKMP
ncbi:MAG: nucleotidyltransferase domain-containing protein [Xenococcaceae cyanobacterium MO_188.B29]|nr:nucleotidyltransferase domain-containing protein [Xenococcaceae cyanobacterium MO_188.B29]